MISQDVREPILLKVLPNSFITFRNLASCIIDTTRIDQPGMIFYHHPDPQCLAGRPIKDYLPIRAHNIIAGEKAVCPCMKVPFRLKDIYHRALS